LPDRLFWVYNYSVKIGILSRNRSLYSTRRLAQAAHQRGHEVSIIDTLAVAVEVGRDAISGPRVRMVVSESYGLARAVQLPQVDAIIPRIGASITYHGLSVVRQFEATNVLTTATSPAIARSRDKLHSLQTMSQAGLPVPRTAVIAQARALFAAMQTVGGPPVVIKLIEGTQGRGVVLARNLATAAAVLAKVHQHKRQALVQEYIAEAAGRDVRVIVVEGRCVAAMERSAPEGEFRANLHRGGTAVPFQLDNATKKLAVDAAKAHGLSVAGVDLIQSNRGPLLLEVNSSPGLEGIETTTQVDVAGEVIAFLEREARKNKRRMRP